jgi:hypothetical protein
MDIIFSLCANFRRLTAAEVRFLRNSEEKNSNKDEGNDTHDEEEEEEKKKMQNLKANTSQTQ